MSRTLRIAIDVLSVILIVIAAVLVIGLFSFLVNVG